MQAGYNYDLKVVRKTDLGYMLSDSKDEVLLHFGDMKKQGEGKVDLENNSTVKAFIFFDKKGRLAATTNEVSVTLDKPGFCRVVEVVSNLGIFVSINTSKDVLISKDYLPYDIDSWPIVGDRILVSLKAKKDAIVGKLMNSYEVEELKSDASYEMEAMILASVIRIGPSGLNLVTYDFKNIFVHKSMFRKKYRVGQEVVVRIVHKGERGYNGSLIANKEKMIDPDKELILEYLKVNGGRIKLDAKSSSEEIEALLHISRKAFKRALGGLYKEHLVTFKDGFTILNKE